MRKWIVMILLLCLTVQPVSALDFAAPEAPEVAKPYMPGEQETFAQGLLYILKTAIFSFRPELAGASCVCLSLIAVALLTSIVNTFSSASAGAVRLTGAVVIGLLLLSPVDTMVRLGVDTASRLSEYGKLLLPVMTGAMAAQGGITTSAALYAGTVFFDTVLSSLLVKLIVPAIYIFLCLSVAIGAVGQDMLKNVRDFIKSAMTWCLKWILYIFTGYMSITGVVSGTVDASALKAAKLTISGAVPVVGSILSDATEAILVSAGAMKNAAGVYGIFALLAVFVGPFVQIGVQYLLLKLSAAVCSVFGYKPIVELVEGFCSAMGFVLALTGTVCVMLLVSIVCFMRGMSG